MSHHINFSGLSWESFEDLCIDLWFDEGYKEIRPLGRRGEGGRDAVFTDQTSGELTIFQFKRWTGHYSTSDLKPAIRNAAKKVVSYRPQRFILNSCQPPNPQVFDWFATLTVELGFQIEYYDRSWIDQRLDNRRQDLRHRYFNVDLEHHEMASLLPSCADQIQRTLKILAPKFSEDLYVTRDAERELNRFFGSEHLCAAVVDRSGSGKTNLLCHTATELLSQGNVVALINGDITYEDDHSLERILAHELGYSSNQFQANLSNLATLLGENEKTCFVFFDGLSEANNLEVARRAFRNMLAQMEVLGHFKVCVSCRDTAWQRVSFDLSHHFFFPGTMVPNSQGQRTPSYELRVGDFSENEFDTAVPKYSQKYNVSFTASRAARQQLKHPLLLRLFCESNQGQILGAIDTFPHASVFDKYLSAKTHAIARRSNGSFDKSLVLNVLQWLASELSMSKEVAQTLSKLSPGLASLVGAAELRQLIHLADEEGLVLLVNRPLNPEPRLRFTYDELQDYLRLGYLLSELPPDIQEQDFIENPSILFNEFGAQLAHNAEAIELLSLIGIILPEQPKRSIFLRELLERDFLTFCSCLARIPPTGNLASCTTETLHDFATALRDWYGAILVSKFQQIRWALDPWFFPLHTPFRREHLGIDLTASPACREVSYAYTANDRAENAVLVTQSSEYPTWTISIEVNGQQIKLHDPDRGALIPIFRSHGGPDLRNVTKRTLNFEFHSLFSGISLNVPERIALHDIANELEDLIKSDYLPVDAIVLLHERARAIARTLPGLSRVEGLNRDEFLPQIPRLLSTYPRMTREYTDMESNIRQLDRLLSNLGKPIEASTLDVPDLEQGESQEISPANFSDEGLSSYLAGVVIKALQSYKIRVERNFEPVSQILNVYANLPCSVVFITDRKSVRLALIPLEEAEENWVRGTTLSSETNVADPNIQIRAHDVHLEQLASQNLEARGRMRPSMKLGSNKLSPIHFFEDIIPIELFFSVTPIADLVKRWLLLDFRSIFGFSAR